MGMKLPGWRTSMGLRTRPLLYKLEAIESSVIFVCKQGPFVPHEEEGILKVDSL